MLRLNAAVASDIVVFSIRSGRLVILLVKRGIAPFKGRWALPGGFVSGSESLDDCARRELAEETAVTGVYLEQLASFGDPTRDPRGRVVSVAYLGLLRLDAQLPAAGSDADATGWHDVEKLPLLAFDHAQIIALARRRLVSKLGYSNIVLQLIPELFTLAEMQSACEIVRGTALDKRNFRKRIAAQAIVVETDEKRMQGAHRPASLYRSSAPGQVVYYE
jgi:8-oxo-dGTP diphosphatase